MTPNENPESASLQTPYLLVGAQHKCALSHIELRADFIGSGYLEAMLM